MNKPDVDSHLDHCIAVINNPETIRDRAHYLYNLALQDKLKHFRVEQNNIVKVADFVCQSIIQNYPDLNIPYHSRWRHFEYGGRDRLKELKRELKDIDKLSFSKSAIDLALISVLLDAGAGAQWTYKENEQAPAVGRSEGLALASFYMFKEGLFSSNPDNPFQCDATALENLDYEKISKGFQVSPNNQIKGLKGRIDLLISLGKAVKSKPEIFGSVNPRPGNLIEYISSEGTEVVEATEILRLILESFSSIWPGRISLQGINLGDVWQHSSLRFNDETDMLMPFHKLSQWLTYSLLEPCEWAGISVVNLDRLTGLAEYRNGGLFIDGEVLHFKDTSSLGHEFKPGDELIVEWRALTLALLDKIHPVVANKLGIELSQFPLAKLLQGGTWAAGRELAKIRDPDGARPPINIISDGTVF
jgi:hypothetical protein